MHFPEFPMRQVHLDFHTSPDVPDVGVDWDADHFVATLQEARVNSITLFATCHHGMCYYPSKVGTVHPALKFDLLGEQIEACHRVGIRAPIYITVAWNVDAAMRHPEWRQLDITGKEVGAGPLEAGWPWLCVGTEYADELIAQTEELIANYDCDGFFYDILMYHADGCVNPPALKSMRKLGLDPHNPLDRRNHNHILARRFMDRTSSLIRDKLPDAGIYYNSRWGLHFADEQQYYSQIEIESLPTGGWGYAFYPMWSRYGRTFDNLPMLGMTGRFHRSWADWGGLKHPDALRFECGGILATGGAVSIGDQLHPRGRLNKAVYEVIGEAFRDVEKVEPYCQNVTPEVQIAVLVLDPGADKANHQSINAQPSSAAGMVSAATDNLEGACKMLLELHHQFDVITDKTCPDFSKYELLVLPDRAYANETVVSRLKEYAKNGGKLFVSHEALLDGDTHLLAEELGISVVGRAESVPDYFVIDDPALYGVLTRPEFPYSLYVGATVKTKPNANTQVLASGYKTYFNRTGEHFCSHGFTPPTSDASEYPALTRNGNALYFYGALFSSYQKHGNLTFRHLFGKCLDLLLPNKILTTCAPATAEVTVNRQTSETGIRQIVHIVNYSPQRRATPHVEVLEEPVPLHNVEISLKRSEPVNKVFVAQTGEGLAYTVSGERVEFTIPKVYAHAVIVVE